MAAMIEWIGGSDFWTHKPQLGLMKVPNSGWVVVRSTFTSSKGFMTISDPVSRKVALAYIKLLSEQS